MNIIPDHLTDHQLAGALARGAELVDQPVQAALSILLRIQGVLDRADVVQHIVQSDLSETPALAAVRWDVLARAVSAGIVPMAPPDRAAILIARDLAGRIGDRLDVLDETMRAAVVDAIGYAVGQRPEITRLRAELADAQAELRALRARLGTGDTRPASGDGSEPLPDGVDGRPVGRPVTWRCARCGQDAIGQHDCPAGDDSVDEAAMAGEIHDLLSGLARRARAAREQRDGGLR